MQKHKPNMTVRIGSACQMFWWLLKTPSSHSFPTLDLWGWDQTNVWLLENVSVKLTPTGENVIVVYKLNSDIAKAGKLTPTNKMTTNSMKHKMTFKDMTSNPDRTILSEPNFITNFRIVNTYKNTHTCQPRYKKSLGITKVSRIDTLRIRNISTTFQGNSN